MNKKERSLRDFIHKIDRPLYLDLSVFANFNEYLKKCDVDVRTSYNKYLAGGFTFKKIDVIDLVAQKQIFDIWTSISTRQNRPINLFYELPDGTKHELKSDSWPIPDYSEYTFSGCSMEFYAVCKDDVIVAYLEVIIVGKTAIVHSTLGHFNYLKSGVMKSLFVEFIKLKWAVLDRLVYGPVSQKDFFKSDLLIKTSKPNAVPNKT